MNEFGRGLEVNQTICHRLICKIIVVPIDGADCVPENSSSIALKTPFMLNTSESIIMVEAIPAMKSQNDQRDGRR